MFSIPCSICGTLCERKNRIKVATCFACKTERMNKKQKERNALHRLIPKRVKETKVVKDLKKNGFVLVYTKYGNYWVHSDALKSKKELRIWMQKESKSAPHRVIPSTQMKKTVKVL